MVDITELLTFLCAIVAPILILSYLAYRTLPANTWGILSRLNHSILAWLESKELEEIEILDYQISAAENEITYEQTSTGKIAPFNYIILAPRQIRKGRHCFSYSTDKAHVKIFDEFYSSYNPEFTGIWIEFKHVELPRFDILQKLVRVSAVYPYNPLTKLELDSQFDWLEDNCKLLIPHDEQSEPVRKLLVGTNRLSFLLNQTHFHILTARGKHLCVFLREELQSGSQHIRQLIGYASLIEEIFAPSPDERIERLKHTQ